MERTSLGVGGSSPRAATLRMASGSGERGGTQLSPAPWALLNNAMAGLGARAAVEMGRVIPLKCQDFKIWVGAAEEAHKHPIIR